MDQPRLTASCLCGAIAVSAPYQQQISVCHCSICRQWSGGPMFALHCGNDVQFSGEGQPSTFASSEWAERGFCPQCGTHLFYHLLPSDEYMLPAGLFQQAPSFQLDNQIFIEQKPAYYDLRNDTVTLTGEQVFAQFEQSH